MMKPAVHDTYVLSLGVGGDLHCTSPWTLHGAGSPCPQIGNGHFLHENVVYASSTFPPTPLPPDLVPVGNGEAFLPSGAREVERAGKREVRSKNHISSTYLHVTNTILKTLPTLAFPTQYVCDHGSRDPGSCRAIHFPVCSGEWSMSADTCSLGYLN